MIGFSVIGASSPTLDPSIIVAVIALVSSIGGIIIANRFTSRSAREAQAKTMFVEQGKLDEQRRQSLIDNMQEEIDRMYSMRLRDREEYNTVRQEDRAMFEAHRRDCTERIALLEQEQRDLRSERNFLVKQVDALVMWSRAVVRVMRSAGIAYPPPPPGVDTDSDGFPPIKH